MVWVAIALISAASNGSAAELAAGYEAVGTLKEDSLRGGSRWGFGIELMLISESRDEKEVKKKRTR